MRTLAAIPLALALCAPAHADILDDNFTHLVVTYQLESQRAVAHSRCVRDVPGAAAWLAERDISDFCLARFGAPRAQALFAGVRLSARLDAQGRTVAADVVEALLEPLIAHAS